jgi:integral membrane protein
MIKRFSNSAMGLFRLISILEGISYLLLLFIAMPLKYLAGADWAVKYVGWVHGLLFVLFCVLLLNVWIKYRWSFKRTVLAFIASLLPFGTFVLEKRLHQAYPSS